MNRGVLGRTRDLVTAVALWVLSVMLMYADHSVLTVVAVPAAASGAVFFVLAMS
jgi:hypothetical protein